MTTYYHGTTALFDHFDISHLFEGDGKCKFGVGIYATSVYRTAVVYAKKGKGDTPYVYTIEVPDLTDENHIVSAKPVHHKQDRRETWSIARRGKTSRQVFPEICRESAAWKQGNYKEDDGQIES